MTKNVILTGASKGIGRATAIKLSQLNCNLALISRDKTKLEETKKFARTIILNVIFSLEILPM